MEDIAAVFAWPAISEADKRLEAIDAAASKNSSSPLPFSAQDEATKRWVHVLDAAVLFGLCLGVHLTTIADSAEAVTRGPESPR